MFPRAFAIVSEGDKKRLPSDEWNYFFAALARVVGFGLSVFA